MEITLSKYPEHTLEIEEIDDFLDDAKSIKGHGILAKSKISDPIKGLLFKAIGMWLISDDMETEFNGSPEEIKVLSDVMLATKDFYQYLRNTEKTDFNVMNSLLNRKSNFSKDFENVFGINWPF